LQDAYEEAMDEIFYIKQAILEKEELIKMSGKIAYCNCGLKSPEKGELQKMFFANTVFKEKHCNLCQELFQPKSGVAICLQ
jgi:hypothetical protein